MAPDDWIAAGYKKFNSKHTKQWAEFGLQKRFDDVKGKKYFITVYAYDNSCFKEFNNLPAWSFQPEVQFDNGNVFDIVLGSGGLISIEYVEEFFENIWQTLSCKHYEEWE